MHPFFDILASHPIIPAFLAANLAIGFWALRKAKANSFEDYALASRSLPTGVLVMTLLGTFVAASTLAHPDYALRYGVLHGLSESFQIVSFLLVGTFIAPCLVHFTNSRTMGDLMQKFYGDMAQLVTGLLGVLFSLLMLVLQATAIGRLSEYLVGIPAVPAIVCIGYIVLIYTTLGGMRAVGYTNVLQVMMAFAVFFFMAWFIVQKVGGLALLLKDLSRYHPQKTAILSHPSLYYRLKLAIFWLLSGSYILTPPLSQRMLAVNDKKKVRKMWYVSAFLYALLCVLILLIGLGALVGRGIFNLRTPYNLTIVLTRTLFDWDSKVIGFIFIGFLGIVLSTMDSYLHAIGISVVQDIMEPLRRLYGVKPLSGQKKVLFSRIWIVIIGYLVILFCYLSNGYFPWRSTYLYIVLSGSLVIIPLILGIIGIKTDIYSWICFCTTHIVCIKLLHWLNWSLYDSFLVSLPLATATYFFAHIIQNRGIVTRKRSERTVAEQG